MKNRLLFLFSYIHILRFVWCDPVKINFDDYGNKYKRVSVPSNTYKVFQVWLQNNDEYIYMVGSSTADFELIHESTNMTFSQELDTKNRKYFLLTPTNTKLVCNNVYPCKFNLMISHQYSSSRSIWIRFNRNMVVKPNKKYSNEISMKKRRRYGIQIHDKDLPVLVKLVPNQDHSKMDIDLYGYHEKKFTSYFFPNSNERNHIKNYPEQLLITKYDSYYANGLFYFFEVYGSTDSSYDDMDYQFQVITKYRPNTILKKILLIFAFTIATSFILGILLSFCCSFRHQILFFLRIRSTPHHNGASKKQIRKLTVTKYKNSDITEEESNCIICLEDYLQNDDIRILRCKHHFHKKCSDEWLFINKKCPLCNQDIDKAQNVHNENKFNKFEIEMVSFNQIQNSEFDELNSETTSIQPQSVGSVPVTLEEA